jgi:hypothetical protein
MIASFAVEPLPTCRLKLREVRERADHLGTGTLSRHVENLFLLGAGWPGAGIDISASCASMHSAFALCILVLSLSMPDSPFRR